MQTCTQQLRLKAVRAEVENEAEEEEGERAGGRRMSQFVDHGIVSVCGRIRNDPLLELLAVSLGSIRFSPLRSLHRFKPSIRLGGIWGRRQAVWSWK
ncbi:hypothetical protein PBY51_017039 [Eleginops maclovinus]|uniref:Uncharacterized protein n=1 Tax=Eleginops maclovinus TaxID=56733 RepID=A0AAN7W9Y8_ELEMC|nr:hypothetical protein PBY51_017039 [Eleginops maclovinus]